MRKDFNQKSLTRDQTQTLSKYIRVDHSPVLASIDPNLTQPWSLFDQKLKILSKSVYVRHKFELISHATEVKKDLLFQERIKKTNEIVN